MTTHLGAINYTPDGWIGHGKHAQAPIMDRDYGSLQFSAALNKDNTPVAMLGALSGAEAVEKGFTASSYYCVWGLTMVTDASSAHIVGTPCALAFIYDAGRFGIDHAGNSPDKGVKAIMAATKDGPYQMMFPFPVKFTPGQAVGLDMFGNPDDNVAVGVYYTVHHDGRIADG
jgi:hypothetical protein